MLYFFAWLLVVVLQVSSLEGIVVKPASLVNKIIIASPGAAAKKAAANPTASAAAANSADPYILPPAVTGAPVNPPQAAAPAPPPPKANLISNKNANFDPRTIRAIAPDSKANPFAAAKANQNGTRLFSITQKGGRVVAAAGGTAGGAAVTGRYCCLSKAQSAVCTAKQTGCRIEGNMAKCGNLDASTSEPVIYGRRGTVNRIASPNLGTLVNTPGPTNARPRVNAPAPQAGSRTAADGDFAFENPEMKDLPACMVAGALGRTTIATNNPRGLVLEAA